MEPTAPRADRANQLAQFLARRWRAHVVPVDATRRYILGRVADATREPAVIERLWTAQPGADVGVALAPSRIVIIDADSKHGIDGRDTRYELEQRYGALPATPRISTPHQGEQDWLRLPEGCTLRSSASKLGAAVDVIAAGVGFASGAGRRWFIDALPSETPLAELPSAWLEAIQSIESIRGDRFRLPDEIGTGGRNDALFRYACSMRARNVEWTLLCAAVRRINQERCQPSLGLREIAALLRSVEAYPVGRRAA
jgi:hypothetical protein